MQEEFVGFVDVTGHTTGEEISLIILKRLVELKLDVNLLRGQCYDGSGIKVECIYILECLNRKHGWLYKRNRTPHRKNVWKGPALVVCQSPVEFGGSRILHSTINSKHDRENRSGTCTARS